ncbi:helix-turn-helix domain-containing protein [Agromyces arachidis]|uniref:helix-turn-helix domain-containing protein n=1 Tax=Agromyces arachidis TaxID=766966 RepID=UPI004056902A
MGGGTPDGDVPVITFDARSAPADHQFELFHDTTAPVFDTLPSDSPADFAAEATDYLVGDLLVSRIAHSPQRMRRSPRHVRCGGEDAVALLVYRRGIAGLRFDRVELRLDEQHVGVIDLAQPFYATCTDVDSVWVVIPRDRLPRSALTGPCARFHRDSPRGRVLRSAVLSVWARLPSARAADAPQLAQGIVDAAEAVLATGDFAPSDPALATAMRDFVGSHLDDLDLDAPTIARTFHCSRSTLFRIFAPFGGVDAYIRDKRLERCLDDLLEPETATRAVNLIATRWGFENPSHFSRLFSARFGLAPSVAHRSARRTSDGYDPSTSRKISTFHEWAAAR